jgi:hypothetical protein
MMIQPEHLIQLLGKSITDPEIERLKEELEDCEVEDFDALVYYSFYKHGLCLMFEGNILPTIQLFSEGVDDFHEYPYPLPQGLRFSFKKADVRLALGQPSRAASGTDIYQYPDHVLYVEFRAKPPSAINRLQLMTLEKFAE